MNLEEIIKDSAWNYPFLFGEDELTRYRVLDQLFFTNGNGYEWEDGKLVILGQNDKDLTQKEHDADVKKFYEYVEKVILPSNNKERDENQVVFDFMGDIPLVMHFYPYSQNYTKIGTMPLDADIDFVLGAMELLNFAVTQPLYCFSSVQPKTIQNSIMKKDEVVVARIWFEEKFKDRLLSKK